MAKLNSSITVVKTTDHGLGNDPTEPLDSAPNRRVLAQRQVRCAI
jgi:hypothetical protein